MSTINLFFVAHQDDELLTFGGPIIQSLDAGCETYVICCSRGERSVIRQRLNNGKGCPWHEGSHSYKMTERSFTLSRDAEFIDSCLALGVPRRGIVFLHERFSDGKLTPWGAMAVMEQYLADYPGATLCTHSPLGGASQHRDHQALGIAALMVSQSQDAEVRFYVDPYYAHELGQEDTAGVMAEDYTSDAQVQVRLGAAALSYRTWDPSRSRYAIGYHSVPSYYAALEQHPCYYRHEVPDGSLAHAFDSWYEKAVAADVNAAKGPLNTKIKKLEQEKGALQKESQQLQGQRDQLQERITALETSRSYRLGRMMTAPYRALRGR